MLKDKVISVNIVTRASGILSCNMKDVSGFDYTKIIRRFM